MPHRTARSIARALIGRCPECGRGRSFRRVYELVEVCPECGVRHERLEGTWVAPAGLAVFAGMSTGCFVGVGQYLESRDPMAITWLVPVVASVVVVLVSYRLFKALVLGVLHRAGWVTPDPLRRGNVIFLQRVRDARERQDRSA
jgi:uncharacterized protein (DUF983 family)